MIDQNFNSLACRFFCAQLEKLRSELACVDSQDNIEPVHQSRVALRRIRSGLEFFDDCFPEKKQKKWLKQFKKLTKKLGSARDKDVQVEYVSEFLLTLTEEQRQYKSGIRLLLMRLEQIRREIQPKILKSVEKFHKKKILPKMLHEVEMLPSCQNEQDMASENQLIFKIARDKVQRQVEDLLSFHDRLLDKDDKEGHHKMRISAKKLRYTLEICNEAFKRKLKKFIKKIKKSQTYLGNIHDLDVWDEYLVQFIAAERQRMVECFGSSSAFTSIQNGLDYFRNKCKEDREELYNQFVEYWMSINDDNLWEKMQSTIDTKRQENI